MTTPDCPTFSCPLAPPEALNIVRILTRVQASTDLIPASLERISALELGRAEQRGARMSRKAMMVMASIFIGFALTIWSTNRKTDNLQARIESVSGDVTIASNTANAAQDQIAVADGKAEAAAIERANLALTAKQNVAHIRAMRSTVAKNSAAIAAIPPPAVPAKKRWFRP